MKSIMLDSKYIDSWNILDWLELFVFYEWEISKSDIIWITGNDDAYYIDDVFSRMTRRLYFYWDSKPYEIAFDVIRKKEIETPSVYEFLLLLSIFWNWYNSWDIWKKFERISNEAFQRYMGGNSMVFGFPNEVSSESDNRNKIDILSEKILERRWWQTPPSSTKDIKLDIISYRQIDSRENKLMIFTQCAAWKNWASKINELNIDRWSHYISFSCKPIRWFSMPYFLDDDNDFYDKTLDSVLLFDRPRIYRFISESPIFSDTSIISELEVVNSEILTYHNSIATQWDS